MDALLLPPSPDPEESITDPANQRANHRPENSSDELKDETMRKKMKPSPLTKRKLKAKKKESDEASSSSCSSSSASNLNSTKRVSRVAHRLRSPPVRLGFTRRTVGERQAEALALPLGMSFAAFANLVRSNSQTLSLSSTQLLVVYWLCSVLSLTCLFPVLSCYVPLVVLAFKFRSSTLKKFASLVF